MCVTDINTHTQDKAETRQRGGSEGDNSQNTPKLFPHPVIQMMIKYVSLISMEFCSLNSFTDYKLRLKGGNSLSVYRERGVEEGSSLLLLLSLPPSSFKSCFSLTFHSSPSLFPSLCVCYVHFYLHPFPFILLPAASNQSLYQLVAVPAALYRLCHSSSPFFLPISICMC